MRLERLTIAGFRGFNAERIIDFDDSLTVIAAPNSHGKTSISEALEFLLYGTTSKVEKADSKDEYKDSYRNRHFAKDHPAYIQATFNAQSAGATTLRIELDADGTTRRLVDNVIVHDWPFLQSLAASARPFVLQHALKYVLLAPPVERFKGFARLLGFTDVDVAYQALLGLCTKPESTIPPEATRLLSDLAAIEARIGTSPTLKKATTLLKRGAQGFAAAHAAIVERIDALIGKPTAAADHRIRLVALRDAAAAQVYKGSVTPRPNTPLETVQLDGALQSLSSTLSSALLDDYALLSGRSALARIQLQATLLSTGVQLLTEDATICPLCERPLDAALSRHITERHAALEKDVQRVTEMGARQKRVADALHVLSRALVVHRDLLLARSAELAATVLPVNDARLKAIFGTANAASSEAVRVAGLSSVVTRERLTKAATQVVTDLDACVAATKDAKENVAQTEVLALSLNAYLGAATIYTAEVEQLDAALKGPAHAFRQLVDAQAGTGELSLLIDYCDKSNSLERALRIRDTLGGLKELKKQLDQTLGEIMEAAMSGELTAAVMKWYDRIRTAGDPDVHFSGFSVDRTKAGDFKSRRLAIKAQSYGTDLASAVSSLSESKLNALGLCVSIATALRSPGPFAFLIIDDPIQSWDAEHEQQFIEVLRTLAAEEKKQVIVLTHQHNWAKAVCAGCRGVNGLRYELTGYTKDGPVLVVRDWSPIEQRIQEADAIANDSSATSERLQQAEEEVRLAACQIAALAAQRKLGQTRSPHKMNGNDVRSILLQAGAPSPKVDSLSAAFGTSDDAHHSAPGYQPNAHRIRQHVGLLRELLTFTKA